MVKASAGGGIAGFIVDNLMGTFPLGTLGGTFHKGLFNLLSGDMDRAYDPGRATQGAQTADFGDLKNMASGLFGDLKAAVQTHLGDHAPGRGPQTADDARQQGRPHATQDARQEAQSQSGLGGWGKALLYGGLALGGLTLLRDFQMGGGFGMPFYGGMAPFMPGMMPGMMPHMMPGLFW